MPTILLVRHATTATTGTTLYGRSPGVDIDERGERQAAATARWLADRGVRAIYASPMARARQTAAAIATATGRDVHVLEGLDEVDFGAWTNRPLAQLRRRKDWQRVQSSPSRWRFPGGESFAEAQQRIVAALEALTGTHTDRQVVVAVSHADMIALAAAWFLGMPLDAFQRLRVSPASVTEVFLGRGGAAPHVGRVNHVPPIAD